MIKKKLAKLSFVHFYMVQVRAEGKHQQTYSSSFVDLDWAEAGLNHVGDYRLDCRHKEFWQTLKLYLPV